MKIRNITGVAALALVAFWGLGFGSTSFSAQPVTSEQPEDSAVTAGRSEWRPFRHCRRRGRLPAPLRPAERVALPDVRYYSAPRLTAIVEKMSRKAQMTPEQHDAVLKYLLTIRSM